MTKTKNVPHKYHHYVPQCYLRQFGYQKNNKKKKDFFIKAFDKQIGKCYPKSVDTVCGKDFLYKLDFVTCKNTKVDEMFLETEYFAKNIESELSRLLPLMERNLLLAVKDNKCGFRLPKLGRQYLSRQLAIQFLRHPDIRNYDFQLIEEIDNEIKDFFKRNNLENIPGSKELLEGKEKFYEDMVMTHAMLSFMNDELISSITNALADNIWIYHYSPNGDFFACDCPIYVTQHVKGENVRHTLMGLNQYGAEVSWTLNPYFTLSIYDKEYFSDILKYDNTISTCSEKTLRHYNIVRYACASKYVFSKSGNFEHAQICYNINKIHHFQ